jgi:hypothetical protein
VSPATNGEARDRLERLAEALDTIEVDGSIQARILQELVSGQKTVSELTGIIYGLGRGEKGFPSSYMRVRRAAKRLESKGFISAPLIGRDKPYHLTRIGSEAVAGVLTSRPHAERRSVRAIIIAMTLVVGAINFLVKSLSPELSAHVSTAFFILLGMSIMVAFGWISEVW